MAWQLPSAASLAHFYRKLNRLKPLEESTMETSLIRCLSTLDLTLLGVGGLCVLTGTVAKEMAGPAVLVSFTVTALEPVCPVQALPTSSPMCLWVSCGPSSLAGMCCSSTSLVVPPWPGPGVATWMPCSATTSTTSLRPYKQLAGALSDPLPGLPGRRHPNSGLCLHLLQSLHLLLAQPHLLGHQPLRHPLYHHPGLLPGQPGNWSTKEAGFATFSYSDFMAGVATCSTPSLASTSLLLPPRRPGTRRRPCPWPSPSLSAWRPRPTSWSPPCLPSWFPGTASTQTLYSPMPSTSGATAGPASSWQRAPSAMLLVPLTPALSILLNICLMLKLGYLTWLCFFSCLLIGLAVYFGSGIRQSKENLREPQEPAVAHYVVFPSSSLEETVQAVQPPAQEPDRMEQPVRP